MKHQTSSSVGLLASGGKSEERETKTGLGRLVMIAVGLDAAASVLKSKMKKAAAAVLAGIGLLAWSIDEAQATCELPVYDVYFYKEDVWRCGYAGSA